MTTLPPTKMIKDVLDGLLGRDVAVAPADAMTSADMVTGALAVYVDDGNGLGAVAGWDLPAAAIMGAAVALVPRKMVESSVDDRYLPENLLENLAEVSNVLASVFHLPDNPHMRLDRMFRPVNAAPADAVALLYALGHRIDLAVEVPGYGSGRLSVSMRF